MKFNPCWIVALVLASVPYTLYGAQTLVTERTLSVDAALEVASAALEHCRKEGSRVTITVLDHAARTKVVLREGGANLHAH